jgi:heat shock protein HtpX
MIITMAQWSAMFGGFGGDRERGNNIASFVVLFVIGIVMSIIVMLIQMAISRAREYQADATGARTSGKPYALASALEKLEAGTHARPMKVTEGVAHLFIVNPLSGRSLANLFSTHPPISERVRRLRNMTIRPNF